MQETGFADAGFADDPDDLTAMLLGARYRLLQCLELGGSPDEARRAPGGTRVPAAADQPRIGLDFARGLECKAPRQERRDGARDDDRAGRSPRDQRFENRPRGGLAVDPDPCGRFATAHDVLGAMNGDVDFGRHLLDRQGGERRVARRVVDGLEAEDGDDIGGP